MFNIVGREMYIKYFHINENYLHTRGLFFFLAFIFCDRIIEHCPEYIRIITECVIT